MKTNPETLASVPARDLAPVESALKEIEEKFRASRAQGGVTAIRHFPARQARASSFPPTLPARLAQVLKARGFSSLYTHQALAYTLAREGRNLVVVTPTASGKTLCYNLPILSELMEKPEARALYLFPTKALSQDQLVELNRWTEQLGDDVRTFTYDGDTPQDARKAIRSRGNLVITNPDMLHAGILPHHTKWQRLFENLRYVVIDELHYYRGVLGSHLANVLRRLKRVARFFGSSPQFICTSATIANPQELAARILEEDVTLIDDNGAPAAEKYFVCYNPPVVNPQLGIRRSYLNETRRLAKTLPLARTSDHHLRQQPPGHGNSGDLSSGGFFPRPRHAAGGARIPGRLPAAGAPGDRARPAQRPLARSGFHQRPRTGNRCGQPGCGAALRLPRHHRLHVAARGPRRAAPGNLGGGARCLQRAARSVHGAEPGIFLRPLARARLRESRQSFYPAEPPEVRGV